jgi:hypothetical protein
VLLSLKRFPVFDEWHTEKLRDPASPSIATPFVKTHSPVEWLGRVKRNNRASRETKLLLRVLEQLLSNGTPLIFRCDGHSAQVPFCIIYNLACYGSNYLLLQIFGDEDAHFRHSFLNGVRS